ncbi:MAG: HypC/HybG/HupF family hydrogenase formation chaperone [Candidatus Coatesbacteria bacterium]|nr:HypC/HybG/HupF family hydrogenase formation chaperone [Candidatus Coatesbacteria bacterium]
MCLAIPGRILEIEGTTARVDFAGPIMPVSLLALDGAQVGDYVLVHAGFAIQRLDEDEARRTLDVFSEVFAQE